MKKLLLLLFLSFGFIESAIAVTYTPDGYGGYRDSNGITYTPDGYGGMRGSNGSTCKKNYYGVITCSGGNQNSGNSGWGAVTNSSNDIGASFGAALGKLFSSSGQSNNSMEGTPYMNRGTSYKFSNGNWSGSDGMKCKMKSDINWSCNNGVSYQMCGQGKFCGVDGTTYQVQNGYIQTSFGTKCRETGNVNNQTYRCQ